MAVANFSRYRVFPNQSRWVGMAATAALHAALVAFLLIHAPAREALREMAPLMVDLITPPKPPAPEAKPVPKVDTPPKPLPVRKVQPRPEPETPLLATTAPSATAPAVTVPVDPKPLPPIEARPAPAAPPAPPAPAPVVVPPVFNADYLDNPAPAYPAISRRMGEQGRVMLRVHVEINGMPTSVAVRTSSGYERLDQAALEAVRRWKFVPAKLGDKTVAAYVVVPIAFNLKD
jgi:protein TonB